MAGKITVELNRAGVLAALKDPGVAAELLRRGNEIKGRADAGGGVHDVQLRIGKTRARVSIITADEDAMAAESMDRNLTRALGAAAPSAAPTADLVAYTNKAGRTTYISARQAANYRSRSRS